MNHDYSGPSIIAIGNPEMYQRYLSDWHECEHIGSLRALKKQFRKERPALVIPCIGNEKDEQLSRDVTKYIRQGLLNADTRVVLLRDPGIELDEISWLEQLQVNACLSAEDAKQSINLTALNRELDTFNHIERYRLQHEAETNMLMCITQFSRSNESLNELLKSFSNSLSALCYSACGFHLHIDKNQHAAIEYSDYPQESIIDQANQLFGLPELPVYFQHVLDERHPQIDLVNEAFELSAIESTLGLKIGSYLTFPITAYDKVLYLLVYLIPESQMDKVSMKQITVINKASEQLSILLERRQAETSLQKQYQRLKNALVELKSTKEELQHKEKMASIGQMAAGIAHEINNPLSYVISNYSSLDNYLKSIIQLQDMQSEFLKAIQSGQEKNIESIKKDLHEFEEEADIPFILEDIRALVSDSFVGLTRVKNIITDLKSLTHTQATELELCDLPKVVDDTVKLLKYFIGDDITIQINLQPLPPFMAHNGLLQQVLTNLIKNAVQALKSANKPESHIIISSVFVENKIDIRVKDNGPGIPEEVQQKIFEPFFTTKNIGEGTGLGLSVTFNIIKRLNGDLKLNTCPGEFTEFIISFPVL